MVPFKTSEELKTTMVAFSELIDQEEIVVDVCQMPNFVGQTRLVISL